MPPKKKEKKSEKKHAPQPGKDLRRAYEHLGRIQKMMPLLPEKDRDVAVEMVQLAQRLVRQSPAKETADLLRGTEHFAFAALEADAGGSQLSPELLQAITEEFRHLSERAADHWDEEGRNPIVVRVFKAMHTRAKSQMRAGKYREALELSRGAEALTHVHGAPGKSLTKGTETKELAHAG